MKKAPGKGFLKVTGIILIVIAVFGIIGTVINIGTYSAMSQGKLDPVMADIFAQAGLTAETLFTSIIISVIQSVLYLAAGIVGVVNCNKTEKANICLVFGILMMLMVFVIRAYNAFTTPFSVWTVIDTIGGLILPLLYFWGALKNRQTPAEGQDEEVL